MYFLQKEKIFSSLFGFLACGPHCTKAARQLNPDLHNVHMHTLKPVKVKIYRVLSVSPVLNFAPLTLDPGMGAGWGGGTVQVHTEPVFLDL